MENNIYDDNCIGCAISRGRENMQGGIIELDGDWILNHYGGSEGFLGWMALQTRYHRMDFNDLRYAELIALGGNIKKIKNALYDYWRDKFREDQIGRVYIVYFFEGIFDKNPSNYHLHLHIIVRTKQIGELLKNQYFGEFKNVAYPNINAWMIHYLKRIPSDEIKKYIFWQRYKEKKDEDVIDLMEFLRTNVARIK
ncbi:MAG: hypothetical protein FJ126_01340 [Deltaproteobacteria bacterium]|nr:hypothetical protein [Deltaproteobacteria bacterium]MBM4293536.1 hypothetical protein [Deltaproteobacteria bacterium]